MRSILLCVIWMPVIPAAFALSGCLPSTRPPERLYPVTYEMDVVRTTQEDFVKQYNFFVFSSPEKAKLIRNEVIAQRMYAIDVQYTEYETALTRESQEVGFGTLTTAGALGTASTLMTPVVTKSILSGLATTILASKGHYESEVLLAQTMRTIQKQMRASRNIIATNISARTNQNVTDYPLSVALSDVEDYYNAGTVTTGVIDASTTVGIKEADTKNLKQEVAQAPASQRAAILRDATIADASTPMTKPPISGVVFPEGLTESEKRGLTPSIISQMQTVVCLPVTGRMTPELRSRVLKRVGKNSGLSLEETNSIPITRRDTQTMIDQYNTIKNSPPLPSRCSQ